MTAICETVRLRLREVAIADAAFLRELMNEPAYLEHIGDRGVRTVADAEAYIAAKFVDSYTRHGFGLYLVEAREGPVPIGICGLVKRDLLTHPDLGFAYLQRYWGNGYGLEAAQAVVRCAHTILRLSTLHAIVAPANVRSQRLLEKLKFKSTGRLQIPGQPFESLLYTWQETSAFESTTVT